MQALQQLWIDQYRSYRSLPGWVQVWVAWLVTINLVGGLDRSTPTGRAVHRSNLVFVPPNVVLVVVQRGYGSALSFSHLVAWPPLVVRLLRRLREPDVPAGERRMAALVALTNSVSIAFDVVDAATWIKGDREVAGGQ